MTLKLQMTTISMVSYMENRKWIKPKEIIVVAVILAICIIIIIALKTREVGNTAQISYGGTIVKVIDLTNASDQIFVFEQNPNVQFNIKNHEISFVNVNCPDKLCENVGYISKPGEIAICMPNKTTLKIINESNDINIIVQNSNLILHL